MTASSAVLEQAALSVAAHRRIKGQLTRTPCIPSRMSFDDDTGLVFKAENFQKTGSFKFRGAMSKLTSLSTDVPAITASSGNHGLALAAAAQMTGHDLTVVLPETVAREKLSRIKALGVATGIQVFEQFEDDHKKDIFECGFFTINKINFCFICILIKNSELCKLLIVKKFRPRNIIIDRR